MIDFYIKKELTISDIYSFISYISNNSNDRVLVLTQDELEYFPNTLDLSDINCLCVYKKAYGDAVIFINLYRLKADLNKLINNINIYSINNKIPCYVPYDDFDGYILTGLSKEPIEMRRIYLEEGEEQDEEYLIFIPKDINSPLY